MQWTNPGHISILAAPQAVIPSRSARRANQSLSGKPLSNAQRPWREPSPGTGAVLDGRTAPLGICPVARRGVFRPLHRFPPSQRLHHSKRHHVRGRLFPPSGIGQSSNPLRQLDLAMGVGPADAERRSVHRQRIQGRRRQVPGADRPIFLRLSDRAARPAAQVGGGSGPADQMLYLGHGDDVRHRRHRLSERPLQRRKRADGGRDRQQAIAGFCRKSQRNGGIDRHGIAARLASAAIETDADMGRDVLYRTSHHGYNPDKLEYRSVQHGRCCSDILRRQA